MKARPSGYRGPGGNLTIRLLTSLDGLGINVDTGRITDLMLAELAEAPQPFNGAAVNGRPAQSRSFPLTGGASPTTTT